MATTKHQSSGHVSKRETWPDVLRGIAVFFVLLVHIRFFAANAVGGVPQWALDFNAFMAPFYLPALFFVAGYFVPVSMRRGPVTFVRRKVVAIGWPLLVWNIINTARGADLFDLRDFTTISYLWFLLYLLAYCVVAAVLHKVPAWLILVVSIALPALTSGPDWMGRSLAFAPYFFFGVLAYGYRDRIAAWARSNWALALIPAGIATGVYCVIEGSVRPPVIQLISLLAIAAGVVVAVRVSNYPSLARPWIWLGQRSLEFYILHWQIGLLVSPLWPEFSEVWLGYVVIGVTVLALTLAAVLAFAMRPLSYAFSIKG